MPKLEARVYYAPKHRTKEEQDKLNQVILRMRNKAYEMDEAIRKERIRDENIIMAIRPKYRGNYPN